MLGLPLARGAEARVRNPDAPLAAVLVNGGTARRVPGTWSATSEWLAERLVQRFPEVAFIEVRYRTKSWNELGSCIDDAADALDAAARPSILVGFSMGGAVAIGVAGHDCAEAVLGLAPWIPAQLDLRPLQGIRFDVVHGAWDRWLPLVPGSARSTLAADSNGRSPQARTAPTPSFRGASTASRSDPTEARSSRCHGPKRGSSPFRMPSSASE